MEETRSALLREEKFAGRFGVGVTREIYVKSNATRIPKPAKIGRTRK
jgi:hypothetical protein